MRIGNEVTKVDGDVLRIIGWQRHRNRRAVGVAVAGRVTDVVQRRAVAGGSRYFDLETARAETSEQIITARIGRRRLQLRGMRGVPQIENDIRNAGLVRVLNA